MTWWVRFESYVRLDANIAGTRYIIKKWTFYTPPIFLSSACFIGRTVDCFGLADASHSSVGDTVSPNVQHRISIV